MMHMYAPLDSVEGCAVTNPEQCPEGTTLQSVGRSGNPMCVTGKVFIKNAVS